MNHNTNHNLIELAKKLSDAIDNEERLSTPKTRELKTKCRNKLKAWLKENYEYDGIREGKYKRYFGEELKIE